MTRSKKLYETSSHLDFNKTDDKTDDVTPPHKADDYLPSPYQQDCKQDVMNSPQCVDVYQTDDICYKKPECGWMYGKQEDEICHFGNVTYCFASSFESCCAPNREVTALVATISFSITVILLILVCRFGKRKVVESKREVDISLAYRPLTEGALHNSSPF
jgi:hypothetical protein